MTPNVAMEPGEQFGGSLIGVLIGLGVGPFAQRGLDEALGLAVGSIRAGTSCSKKQTLAPQIKLGVVPAGTRLAPKPAGIKDWERCRPT